MGNDNPYAALWTLIGAKLFARENGTSPLIGFNWSNSANNETLEITAEFRKALGFEDVVRFEHHITETWKSIVKQPYDRRRELTQIAGHVANIAAKHEGGDPQVELTLPHKSDILDYFREKKEVIDSGDWDGLKINFMEKSRPITPCVDGNGLSFMRRKFTGSSGPFDLFRPTAQGHRGKSGTSCEKDSHGAPSSLPQDDIRKGEKKSCHL
jgi:hypothetical protein